jgi:nucleoside-diphosphate-sugar epimerase
MSIVLVTGGSGFVGVHAILQLLAAGHEVRTTVRYPERNKDVLAMLREGGAPSAERLSFFHRRPHAGRRLGRGHGGLRLRAARRVAAFVQRAQGRERTDHPRA